MYLFIFSMFHTPRMKKELSILLNTPPIGIHVNIKKDSTFILDVGNNHVFLKHFI